MAIGWLVDLPEADSYFNDERLERSAWDNISNDVDKTACLMNAYNRIFYHDDTNVPASGSETAAQRVYLIKAQCEMAAYLVDHLADEDRRKGLQAQAVTDAGIVKEKYDKDKLYDLPLPPFVIAILKKAGFIKQQRFFATNVERDEDYGVNQSIDAYDDLGE